MNAQASYFKDDILTGVALSIKNLQAQDSEIKMHDPKASYSIMKYNSHFRNLINSVDLALSFGLKDPGRGYWPFIKKIAHSSVLKLIDDHKNATNDINKGYIWLYSTFIEQSLDSYIKIMVSEVKLIKFFYKEFALLRDNERSDIFRSLLTGMEKLNFSLNINEPYLDYGHDPVLRQEKVVIHIPPSRFLYEKQPDVTKNTEKEKLKKFPDLLKTHSRKSSISQVEVSKSQAKPSSLESKKDEEDLVYYSKHNKRRSRLMNDEAVTINSVGREDNLEGSMPEVAQSLDDTRKSEGELLKECDPDPGISQGNYESFLSKYQVAEKSKESAENVGNETNSVSSDDHGEDHGDDHGEDHELYRVDSFDKFCHSYKDYIDDLFVKTSTSAVTQSFVQSPNNSFHFKESLSNHDMARFNTKNGILLPGLPKRPSLEEDAKRLPEFILPENVKVLLSLEVFHHPNESFVKMFEISVAFLAGLAIPVLLLVSNNALYFVRRKALSEYEKVMSINVASMNKIKVGLNFQDVFISHDGGCLHFSTADETLSRYLVSTIKSVLSSSEITEQMVTPNTNNDLYLILQDWLICHSQCENEDPNPFYFGLIYYADSITKERGKTEVIKVGYLRYHEIAFFSDWQEAYFTLRGWMLYRYSIKKSQQSKTLCDLRTCGGCIRTENCNEWFTCKILGEDGLTPIMELAAFDENEINEWIIAICQVVADSKYDRGKKMVEVDMILPCGVLVTNEKILIFNQEIKSGSLIIKDSFNIKDVTQVYVDNSDRTFCALSMERRYEENFKAEKRIALMKFNSEFELGKFEKELAPRWNLLYQVPLQFVLMNDELKNTINHTLSYRDVKYFDIGHRTLREFIES